MTTADRFIADLGKQPYVAGASISTTSHFDVTDPASGEVIASVGDATAEHAVLALDAAVSSAAAWAATAPRERAEILRNAFELILARADEFATLMTLEMGKPLAEAYGEVRYGAEFFRWFSEEACRVEGRWSTAPAGGATMLTMHQPVGPVYAITPWNFPLAMGTRKLGPALAAGCTAIVKPSEWTPLTMLALTELLTTAGVPAGVVNCLPTTNAAALSAPLLADDRLRKLTFTGSTKIGRQLLAQAAPNVLRTSMELGGNAPFLVLRDADVDAAVAGAMIAKFRNNGEACTAANRFYIHRDRYTEFESKFVAAVEQLVLGPGIEERSTLGPLINDAAVQKVSALVDDALERGAQLLVGGDQLVGAGHFYTPTVLGQVPPTARLLSEEIFGPVAPLVQVDSDEEAIRLANESEFGLMAYVYSQGLAPGLAAVSALESGMVGLNTGLVSNPAAPFGGVKQSGLGREGSHEGIAEYLEVKYVGLPS